MLQTALESNFIPDEMRSVIRRMIERTLETLHIKAVEEKGLAEKKVVEYEAKQTQMNEYIRRYAELQLKIEQETRRIEANRQFYNIIQNMGYALNGVPRWEIRVMSPPPERRLDERAYTERVRQHSNQELHSKVTTPKNNQAGFEFFNIESFWHRKNPFTTQILSRNCPDFFCKCLIRRACPETVQMILK